MRAGLAVLLAGLALLGLSAAGALRAPVPARPPTAEERAEAERTVHELLALVRHLHGSGGDPRFAERVPAAPEVVDELLREIAWVRHQGWIEELQLARLELSPAERTEDGALELGAREFWIARRRPVADAAAEPRLSSSVLATRYRLEREGGRWRVVEWRHEAASGAGGVAP